VKDIVAKYFEVRYSPRQTQGGVDGYQRMRGSLIRMLLGRMFSSADYTGLSDEQKIKEVEEGIREVDDAARDQMITRVVDRRLGRQEAGVPIGPPGR
jgi:hypothetical protein